MTPSAARGDGPPPAPGHERPAAHPRALLAIASVAVALAAADTYVVVLALTDMMAGVGLGVGALQRATPIISGFLLGYVATLPLIGRLADLVARQRVLVACLTIFILGSVATAMATDLPVLIGGRVLQGIGGGGLVPATLALVADLWPADRRALPLGVVGAVQELGSVLGPVMGALILGIGSWRGIFWINALLGVVLVGLVARFGRVRASVSGRAFETGSAREQLAPPAVRGPDGPPPGDRGGRRGARIAITGTALGITGLALQAPEALTASVTWGAPFVLFAGGDARLWTPIGMLGLVLTLVAAGWWVRAGWPTLRRADLLGAALVAWALGSIILTFASSDPEREVVGPWGLALLPTTALALVGYLWHHRRVESPLIPAGVLRGRAVWALLVSVVVGIALVAVVVDLPLLARLAHSTSDIDSALVLVRFLLAVPIGALAGGWACRRRGDGLVASLGLAAAGLGLLVMSSWGRGSLATLTSVLVLAVVGCGLGLVLAPVNNAALALSPPDAHGSVSSLVVVARMIGMVVGLAVLTAVGLHAYFQAVARLPNPADTTALADAAIVQVQWVFRGAALTALVGALVAIGMGLRRPEGAPSSRFVGL